MRLSADLRFAARTLRASPVLTLVAVAALALGIGATTTVFGVANAFFFRPLPFFEPTRLVHVWATDRVAHESELRVSLPAFEDWRRDNPAFDDLGLFNYSGADLAEGAQPEHIAVGRVSANVFRLLGAHPLLGTVFADGDDQPGHRRVVVLSYGTWRRRFGGRRDVLGTIVHIDGVAHTVVGVMPASFAFPLNTSELWIPYVLDAATYGRERSTFQVVGRLASGVTLPAANAVMTERARAVERAHPREEANHGARVVPLRDALDFASDVVGPLSVSLFVAAALVLALACANIASALLARATAREHEMAIRAAIGGTRRQLVAQLLTESVLLAVIGALAGVVLAFVLLRLLAAAIPAQLYRVGSIEIDGPALMVSGAISLCAAALFGFAPALRATRGSVIEIMRSGRGISGSPGVRRWQGVLAVVQLALTATLLVAATVVLRGLESLRRTNPGFDPHGVLAVTFMPSRERYVDDAAVLALQRRLIAAAGIPDVESAAIVDNLPLNHERDTQEYLADGDGAAGAARSPRSADIVSVSPKYFDVLRVPVLSGRAFTEADGPGAPRVLLINQAMRRTWPASDLVGRTVRLVEQGRVVRATVVGIVANVRQSRLDGSPEALFYAPQAQRPARYFRLLLRGRGDSLSLTEAARRIARAADPSLPIAESRSLQAVVDQFLLPQRGLLTALTGLGAGALLLALFGVYGVMSYLVAQRVAEIGIRAALGATRADIVTLTLSRGVALTTLGVVIGSGTGFALSRLLGQVVAGAEAQSAGPLLVVPAALAVLSLLACMEPVWRALSIDPARALRHQ